LALVDGLLIAWLQARGIRD
jgi:hypothetical protein